MNVLDRFAATLASPEAEVLGHVRRFIEWHADSVDEFVPGSQDDVALRTYLMQLRIDGTSEESQHEHIAALRRFYDWAESTGLLDEYHPFHEFSIERPLISRDQIRRREEIFAGSPEEREIARLSALNQLSEQLNRSTDMRMTLSTALKTLLSLMNLQTAWAFLLPSASGPSIFVSVSAPDTFALAAATGLPPGLEKRDRFWLRDPQLCHCQEIMLKGQMQRAVNVVECTRLMRAARDDGDNQGLQFHASVPVIASGQTLGIINVATEDWQFLTATDLQLLSAVGAQVATALERARLFDVARSQQQRLERELKLAREIQDSLLPEVLPNIPGYSLAADWRSALEMAGDFFDIFRLPEDKWGIVVADVSDKGAAAAMYMAMTRSLIRASAANYASPAGALKDVNQQMIEHSTSDMFVTAFYAVLDPQEHTILYANAGQNPALLQRAAGGIEELGPTGAVLGVLDELTLEDVGLELGPGDSLIIYTDGVTDALDAEGEDYGVTRLRQALTASPKGNATMMLDHHTGHLAAFTGDTPQFDDITFFILYRE